MNLLLTIGILFVLFRFGRRLLDRAHTVVEFEGRRARLVRGRPPSGMMHDLEEAARLMGGESGKLALRGQMDTLEVTVRGLSPGNQQRVRNVVQLYRGRIRRPGRS